ncbi:MAG: FecR domain-containing protein [Agriterribacter sp.]
MKSSKKYTKKGRGTVEYMETLQDHIRRLYLEKLTHTISGEEDIILQQLLRDNSEAQLVWAELEQQRAALNVDRVLAAIDAEQELKKWHQETQLRKPFVRYGWWAGAAAASIIGIIALVWYNQSVKQPSPEKIAENKPGLIKAAGVKLVLANGKTVNFSKSQAQEYTVDGVALEHSGDQLAYKGAGTGAEAVMFNTLEIPAKTDYSITLSDGTRVFLNSKSTLRFPFHFDNRQREIFIEGEAYLEVAKDTKRPFIVHTPLTDIRVTGTKFNVNTYEEGTVRTSLVEGSVVLNDANKKSIALHPGLEALYHRNKGFTSNNFDAAETLSWREGIFYFQRQPLGELSGIIARWFGLQLQFEQAALSEHAVSGLLEKGRLDEFLNNLHKTAGIDHSLNDTILVLTKR